jgi:hypothetical protein
MLVNRDYKDAEGSWGPISVKKAETQFQGIRFRNNRYSGNPSFCVPKALMTPNTIKAWNWNDRSDVDLTKWRALVER